MARALAVSHIARIRSSSHSAIENIIRRTSLPVSVDKSRPSWTLINVPACLADSFDRRKAVHKGATEPIEFRDNDPIGVMRFHPLDRKSEEGSIGARSRFVELFVHLAKHRAMEFCPPFNLVPLDRWRNEPRTTAAGNLGDTDVAIDEHLAPLIWMKSRRESHPRHS